MLIKDISYQEQWQPLCSVDWNHLCNCGRVHHEEQFCEIIFNFDQWIRRCRLKPFIRALVVPLLGVMEPFVQIW